MDIADMLGYVIERQVSDLHILTGLPPMVRATSRLFPIPDSKPLTEEASQQAIFALLTPEQKDLLLVNKELDFSYQLEDLARFRINAYYASGRLAAALRLIPKEIRTIEELNLPRIMHAFAGNKQGFILITGPTGHGKTTSLAAIINEINTSRAEHIVTIEDPIEYVFTPDKSIISQRELHSDTHSWDVALRSVLREDPNVVLVGEMRDYETIAAALTVAETGHLVLATLHTNSAAQTVDRIVDVFPEHQQPQVKMQLAATLLGIVAQRLIPTVDGELIPACEILLATPAIRATIREGKTHLIDNIIQTSREIGMETLEMSLAELIKKGRVSLESAMEYALRPDELNRIIRGAKRK